MSFIGDKKSFYDSLPRKRSAVGVLIFENDRLLVLEPNYKTNWVVPGGIVEKLESPREAALRECFEELGVHITLTGLLCVDYKRGNSETGDAVHFLFAGTIPDNSEFKIGEKEIKNFYWLPAEQAFAKFDEHLRTRVQCGLRAITSKHPIYCEEGQPVL